MSAEDPGPFAFPCGATMIENAFADLSVDDYHADKIDPDTPSLSSSIAHTIIYKSPRHAWNDHPRLNPNFRRRQSDKFDLGKTLHASILEGADPYASDRYVIVAASDWRTKAARQEKAEAYEAGLTPLLEYQAEKVADLMLQVGPDVRKVLGPGQPEVPMVWRQEGVLCRSRNDWVPDEGPVIFDVKTTAAAAEPEAWCRQHVWRMNSDERLLMQAVFYAEGVRACLGRAVKLQWLVVEIEPPYEHVTVGLDERAEEIAYYDLQRAVKLWERCLEEDNWPGYQGDVYLTGPPSYIDRQFETKLVEEKL